MRTCLWQRMRQTSREKLCGQDKDRNTSNKETTESAPKEMEDIILDIIEKEEEEAKGFCRQEVT